MLVDWSVRIVYRAAGTCLFKNSLPFIWRKVLATLASTTAYIDIKWQILWSTNYARRWSILQAGLLTILSESIANTYTDIWFKKYCQYQYQYFFHKVLAIPIPILSNQYKYTNIINIVFLHFDNKIVKLSMQMSVKVLPLQLLLFTVGRVFSPLQDSEICTA